MKRNLILISICLLLLPVSAAAADLTAGDFDDNLNYEHFLNFRRGMENILPGLNLDDRITIRCVDGEGRGLPNFQVRISDPSSGRTVIETRSGHDGTFRFFPDLDGVRDPGNLDVEVTDPIDPENSRKVELTGEKSEIEVVLDEARYTTPDVLDVCFVMDTTGSMRDELSYITREFEDIVSRVKGSYQVERMRFALVVYRDFGDDYVVKEYDFTDSVSEMRSRLSDQIASGGGDYPEAMDEAVFKANTLSWSSKNAARVMFLVADAPPHDDRMDDTLDGIREARGSGIHIYPLASSGVRDRAELIMRVSAVVTHGRYLFLTDDSGIGNSHAPPHIPGYIVTTLKDLMVRIVESEISGRRVEADPQNVIRTVGYVVDGVALTYEEFRNSTQDDGYVNNSEAEDEDADSVKPLDDGPEVPGSDPGSPSMERGSEGEIYGYEPMEGGDADCIGSCEEDANSVIGFMFLVLGAGAAGIILVIGYAVQRKKK